MVKIQFIGLFVVAAIWGCFMMEEVSAFNHVIGGRFGWRVPPNVTFYQEWATPRTFGVGDKLVFPFRTAVHSIIEVGEKDFANCTQKEYKKRYQNGPLVIQLNKTGDYFYYCGIGRHCELGQKLKITVTNEKGTSGSKLFITGSKLQLAEGPSAATKSAASPVLCKVGMVSASLFTFLLSLFI